MAEAIIPIQTDTLTTQPGGVRTITVPIVVDGVTTTVQMQVVCLADANGVILDPARDDILREVANELKDIKKLLAIAYGVAVFEDSPGTGQAGLGF